MKLNSKYMKRCLKKLKEMAAPLENWFCVSVVDHLGEYTNIALTDCELCGCSQVRYIHVMKHYDFNELLSVGCVCAGVMEGDVLRAKERNRLLKNRANRRVNFLKGGWSRLQSNIWTRKYRGEVIYMIKLSDEQNQYKLSYMDKTINQYKGREIDNPLTASYAAFDLIDPIENIINA